MDDNLESLLLTHSNVRDIVRKCMPELVKKLDLEPVLDHLIATDVLSVDSVDEYEQKKDGINNQQQQLNRWFLRRFVLKGSKQLSQQLIMAINNTQHEVEGHCELMKLINEKLLGISQSSYTHSTTDTPEQSTTDTPVQFSMDHPVLSTTDTPEQSTTDPPVQSTTDTPVQSSTVQSTTDTPIQSTMDPPVQSATVTPVQFTTDTPEQSTMDPPVQSTTDTPVQSTADTPEQSTTDPPVQSTTDTPVQSSTVQSTTDTPVQSTIDPPVQSSTDTPVQFTTDTPEQSATDTPVQSTTDTAEQSTTDTPVQSITDTPVQFTTDPPVQSITDTPEQSANDTSEQSITDTPEQSATDTLVQSTTDPPVQSTTDTPVQSTTDTPEQSATDTPVQSTTDTPEQSATDTPEQSTTDTPVQSITDTPAQSTTDTPEQSATDTPEQSTTDTPVQSTTDTPEQSATDTPVQSTTDTPEQSATDTPEQSATDTPAIDTSVQFTTDNLVLLDHMIHKPPKSFTFIMPEGKKLREYQKELAATGMEGVNYIVCAPTGTGKTLIASMVVADHLAKRPDGKVLFLVNKVPLAEQQCKEVKQYIPDLQAQFITGDSGIQLSLFQLLRDNIMVVCTDGMFFNELKTSLLTSADRLSLSDITLLIIDECHNAKKNSPYAMIMEHYVKIKMSGANSQDIIPCLPQIMGLTASPGAGENPQGEVEKTLEHLLNLCALLDAQGGIRVVKENIVELVRVCTQPDFDLIKTSQRSSSDPFLQLLHTTMKSFESWVKENFKIACPHNRQHQAYENWVVSQRQQSELRDGVHERDLRIALTYLQCYYNSLKMYHELNQNDAIAVLREKITMTTQDKATQCELTFQQTFNNFLKQAAAIPSVDNPMLVRLRLLLEKQFHELPTTRGIVFATTKDTAQRMCYWLQGTPQLQSIIKPGVVTGQSKEEMGGMSQQKQRSAIERFRDDRLNLLVATTVLEEGLDVAACNLVVRYNHVTNEIARVQAQGRARAKNSRCYAIMVMDSPKVLQEQLNKEKGDLTLEAMEFLPEGDKLRKEINLRQEQLLKDRERRERLERELKTQDSSHIQLLCKGCDSVICELSDMRVVGESHHVVIDDKIHERCIKKGPSTPMSKGEIEIGKKVLCANCEKEWGVMIKWPHYGKQYPAIKCKFVLFRHPTGEKHYYKQWKTAPFTIAKYE